MRKPKEEMKQARRTYRKEKREAKQAYKHQDNQSYNLFKTRQKEAKRLFSKHPDQLTRIKATLKEKYQSEKRFYQAEQRQELAQSKSRYIDKVKLAPSNALTAKELKRYKLPALQKDYRTSKERFYVSRQELKEERRKDLLQSLCVHGRKETAENHFSLRQTNFRPYQTEKSKASVGVQVARSQRAKRLFQQGKEGQFRFNKFPSQVEKKTNHLVQGKTLHFKRVWKSESRQNSPKVNSRFFWQASPEVKEKKAALTQAKSDYQDVKTKLKQGKRAYHFKRPRTRILKTGRFMIKEAVDLLSDHEDLSSLRDMEQTIRKSRHYSTFTYQVGKTSIQVGKGTFHFGRNRVANLRERTNNFKVGHGFKLNDRRRHLNRRIKRYIVNAKYKISQSARRTRDFIKHIPQLVKNFFYHLTTWWYFLGFFLLLVLFSGFISVSSRVLIQQDEFELNKAYTHMTLEDAKNSIKDKNGTTYFTKIDEVMAYMNYRFQDYHLGEMMTSTVNANSTTGFYANNDTYKSYLSQLWIDLNGGDSLKSMAELYKEKGKYHLTQEEMEELNEYKEEGIYMALYELDNPFQGQGETEALTMTYRYGYYNRDGKADISYHIILEAKQGQVIVAPMDGIIKLDGDDVLIVSGEGQIIEARLRLKDIATGRVLDGQKVYTGEIIGETKTDQGLKIYYQKYDVDEKKLVYVNPAFYFPNVVQVQTTILPSIGQFQGDEVGRAKVIYDFLKAKGASNQFIAAVLGNWSVESGINPKRAESDYISPPIGATDSSWDDENWLSIGEPALYGGLYPNILRRGLGLGQWTDTRDGSIRNTLLREYAKSKNKEWYNLELQLDFMLNGDSPYYKNWVAQHMKDTGSPATLAQLFLIYWEGNAGDKLVERQTRAIEWFYQIEKGFSQAAPGTAKVDLKGLEAVRGDLYDGLVPGSGDDIGYPWGQCTWGVAKRMNQLGLKLKGREGSKIPIISTMGNGMDWVGTAARLGGETGMTPKAGAIISFNFGDPWGHVALVEKVYPDGSFLISETNYGGSAYNPTGVYTFRTFSTVEGNMSFAYTTK